MKKSDRVTTAQISALTDFQQACMLHYLTGYMEKSTKFQEALLGAYRAQTETREERAARWAAEKAEPGL